MGALNIVIRLELARVSSSMNSVDHGAVGDIECEKSGGCIGSKWE